MITIKTRLNDGIYKSQGGGEVKTHYEYTTGPRNLLKAIHQLLAHGKHMKECYGNIGCGYSWMEIDGIKIDQCDLEPVIMTEERETGFNAPITCTAKAREYLADFYALHKAEKN